MTLINRYSIKKFISKINRQALEKRESYYGNDAAKFVKSSAYNQEEFYEFCPVCEANLTLQRGYNNTIKHWVCRGCGETLTNPDVPEDPKARFGEREIAWVCDGCSQLLNTQEGFYDNSGIWNCLECGYENIISESEIYESETDYQAQKNSPTKGLSEADILEIYSYEELDSIDGREDITLVRRNEDNKLFVKKFLKIYDVSIYEFVKEYPVSNMPRIESMFKGDNGITIIEEYIEGDNLLDLVNENAISLGRALEIVKELCHILLSLNNLDTPIIHRDIKPSNIVISKNGDVFLLDINVAKWAEEEKTGNTRLFGTTYFAAPEQFGYGLEPISTKADIYGLGQLFNILLTGKYPAEEKAPEPYWSVIEKCIKLEASERCDIKELIKEIDGLVVE